MKRLSLILITCILCIFFLNCSQSVFSNENSKTINKDTLKFKTIPLSEILSIDEIIPLETSPQCLLENISKLIFFNNYFFVLDVGSRAVLAFSSTGKFIRRYGSIGKGPGEFVTPISICVNEADNSLLIYDLSTGNILIYSINGAFIKSIKVDDGLTGKDIEIKDNVIYLNTTLYSKAQYEKSYNVRLFNMDGKYLGGVLKVSENNLGWIGDLDNIYSFTKFGDSLRYYNSISNNIYSLDKKNVDVLYTIKSKKYLTEKDVKQLFGNKEGLYIHEKINMLLEAKKTITFIKLLENSKYAFVFEFFMNVVILNKYTKEATRGRIIDDITNINSTLTD